MHSPLSSAPVSRRRQWQNIIPNPRDRYEAARNGLHHAEGTYRLEVEINSNETHGMMGRIKRPLCQCHSTQVDHFSSTHFYSSAPCTYTTATGPGRSRRNQQAALSAGRSPMDHRTIGPSVRPSDRPSKRAATMPPQKSRSRTTGQQQQSGHAVLQLSLC